MGRRSAGKSAASESREGEDREGRFHFFSKFDPQKERPAPLVAPENGRAGRAYFPLRDVKRDRSDKREK